MKTLPELTDFNAQSLRELGYHAVRVSIFEHWLSEEEADSCMVMTYSDAVGTPALSEYLVGEARFLNFYERLTRSESLYLNLFDPSSEAMISRRVTELRFGACVVLNLREMGSMDAYLANRGIRALGGVDRTDLFLAESAEGLSYLTQLAKECGLYTLA